MTDASRERAAQLVALGLERHEARWLAEEFSDPSDLHAAAKRRLAGEPLQYVIGHWPFRTLDLMVDPRALIPRPETEGLVDVALGELARAGAPAPAILDLGCGSGAIGLALLAELRARGVAATLIAVDESTDALDLARHNAQRNDVASVSFVRSSWFDELDYSLRGRFDLIVANPPYVGEMEIAGLDAVLAYEPRAALVANDADGVSGFADVAAIIAQSREWLSASGALVCEHGGAQGAAACAAALRAGFSLVVDHDDLAGLSRVVVARR